ncbi:uncharacterized protein L199_004668 [Kwoniella botswanensis]|uniref:uncharacterized protein n=1 Tax=Kwoniella botswanensis TaxID=1268659 RepID=UPI00315DFDC6
MSSEGKTPLSIPKQPLDILLPFPKQSSNGHTIELLRQLVGKILAKDEVYSITYSPVLCPVSKEDGGGNNQLFTIKPHWWRNPNGEWEWRDGQRNPENARPQGQVQLESLSKTIHILFLGIRHISDHDLKQKSIERIEKLLRVFFVDIDTRMEPQVRFSQCHPGQEPMKGNECFVIAIRYLILVNQALLLSGSSIKQDLVQQIKEWINEQVVWMEESDQGMKAKNAEKPLWYYVILAFHRQFIQGDTSSITLATSSFNEWFAKHPIPQDVFAESLRHDNPRHKCLFTLEPLFMLASLTVPLHHEQGISDDIKTYLRECVEYVKSVEQGPIESPLEDDIRYMARVAWFERILYGWNGQGERDAEGKEEPSGEGWENGWSARMRIMWGFI